MNPKTRTKSVHTDDTTTAIITMSGLCGGMYGTLSGNPLLLHITIDGIITVVACGMLSALSGYITRFISEKLEKRKL